MLIIKLDPNYLIESSLKFIGSSITKKNEYYKNPSFPSEL